MAYSQITLSQKYSLVDEYLVRGPHPSVSALFQLKNNPWNVTQIYDFRHVSNLHFKFIEKWCCRLLGIKYIKVPYSNLYGQYPDLSVFESIAQSVRENGMNGGKTLFHCNSGRHRTAHFAAFYKLTRGEPLDVVRARLAAEYEQTVLEIIQEQIIDRDYFSRTVMQYDGSNPITGAFIKYNNMIAMGLEKAHLMFMGRLGM